ncbi:DUF3618 domain-containing protein [Streptomyces sp. SBT349]|uniref:DUF3618 domain-containing protein n=1 Tax=Streptomyces sp. SBT349 TaxID=1580539 RepID=UPI00066DC580|nr:DUF3618 domain-containing protein [Streptomyces sp. SBT349]
MGTSPERIRADIEATRAELAADLDQLADHASPRGMARRRGVRLSAAATALRERAMGGSAQGAGRTKEQGRRAREQGSRAARNTRETASRAGDAVARTPERAASTTRGNALVAGAVAFGAGLLVAALTPGTRPEERALGGAAAPLTNAAKESARHLREDTTEAGRRAAGNIKDAQGPAASGAGE